MFRLRHSSLGAEDSDCSLFLFVVYDARTRIVRYRISKLQRVSPPTKEVHLRWHLRAGVHPSAPRHSWSQWWPT